MDGTGHYLRHWRTIYLILAALTLASSGCLAVAAGAAAGAGAAGYVYAKGRVGYPFNASFEDSWSATRTALTELGLPILAEERENATSGFIKTQASDGSTVRVYLEVDQSDFPADGPVTHISVRVGTFGDYPISDRILAQVSAHLVPASKGGNPPPGAPLRPVAAPPPPWSAAPTALPPPTAPPPLLAPVPVKP